MSLFKINPDDLENFTIVTNPWRSFSSSSAGVTGSVHVFARRSPIEKEVAPVSAFLDVTRDDSDINAMLRDIKQSSGSLTQKLEAYFEKVDEQSASVRRAKTLEIIRFTPTVGFTSNTLRKSAVKDTLFGYYRTISPNMQWAYTNYNTLNFFTSSAVPTGSVLLYPNFDLPFQQRALATATTYDVSGAFSFDFFINPRYQQDQPDGDYKAGTILHLSSSYALSLVSGSAKDENGRSVGFRLKLQLSQSADVSPSVATPSTSPPDNFTFLSDDNALRYNNWHRVVVRWGTSLVNNGTGSFNVDGVDRGFFTIPSASLMVHSPVGNDVPRVLCVGNYYEGRNFGTSEQSYFFAHDTAVREGLIELSPDTGIDEPVHYAFNHPLRAELHDLSIRRYYEGANDIAVSASVGPTLAEVQSDRFALYVPPFFTKASPIRQNVGGYGGVLQTPFFEIDGTTDDPFNVAMSFGVNGHYINLENFTKDFANGTWPRLARLSGSAIQGTTDSRSANAFLYDDPFVRKRNLTIMPCDDGNWTPQTQLLDGEPDMGKFVNDLGQVDTGLVNLDNLISTGSLLFDVNYDGVDEAASQRAQAFLTDAIGFSPEQPGLSPGQAYSAFARRVANAVSDGTLDSGVQAGAPLTIYQRTRDNSSNQVVFFDISNLYYGKRILPGTLELFDPSLTGSGGAVSVKLKDDGLGNIYRADSLTPHATWNSVGNVFYNEGIVVIKSPHLYFTGADQYAVSFRGEQNVHVSRLNAIAPANTLNSSSNPSFLPVSASAYPNDPESEFVYITGINVHDADLNVVARTQLAQPIVKRHGDRVLFKIKIDY